jgi:hypothetical protein
MNSIFGIILSVAAAFLMFWLIGLLGVFIYGLIAGLKKEILRRKRRAFLKRLEQEKPWQKN